MIFSIVVLFCCAVRSQVPPGSLVPRVLDGSGQIIRHISGHFVSGQRLGFFGDCSEKEADEEEESSPVRRLLSDIELYCRRLQRRAVGSKAAAAVAYDADADW